MIWWRDNLDFRLEFEEIVSSCRVDEKMIRRRLALFMGNGAHLGFSGFTNSKWQKIIY